jgi:hypothetical protein
MFKAADEICGILNNNRYYFLFALDPIYLFPGAAGRRYGRRIVSFTGPIERSGEPYSETGFSA